MPTKLPQDDNGNSIQLLAYKPNSCTKKTASAAAQLFGPYSCKVVTLFATAVCNFETGDVSVVADGSDHPCPANFPVDIPLNGRAFLSVYGTADIYVSERE